MVERRYARANVKIDTAVFVDGASDGSTPGELHVLGGGGAFLHIQGDYEIGRLVSLRFSLPQSPEIGCRAVVRNKPSLNGVGLEFLELAGDDRRAISDYVKLLRRRGEDDSPADE